MELTHTQIMKLVRWANEGDRDGGTTAWGPKFSDAMKVAQQVRDEYNTYEKPVRKV